VIRQTWAIFVDAYRELNARKMFWIVMLLSLICVAVLACVGLYETKDASGKITQRGITLLVWKFPIEIFDYINLQKATFYNLMFYTVGFKIWLTWAATILALISTAGIIPDFITGGSIEMSLSKPIGRLRLFLTKYVAGLLFVVLQVSVFTLASFLVIGLRSGAWQPSLFIAVPLVVAFFSYLYGFLVLIGMLTRSAIASLLITICLWLAIFCLHVAEAGPLLQAKVRQDQLILLRENDIVNTRTRLETRRTEESAQEAEPATGDTPSTQPKASRADKSAADIEKELADKEQRLASAKEDQTRLNTVHSLLFATKTVLPKTSETMELLQRSLVSATELEGFIDNAPEPPRRRQNRDDLRVSEVSVQKEVSRILRERSVGWVLGTSLLFEGCVVAIAAWLFCRRDF